MERLFAEFRAEVSGDTLRGHAAVFGQVAELAGSLEGIAPTAFDQALKRGDDVRALINHDPSKLLGRTASGTLRLSTDATGLGFEVDLPDTRDAQDLRVLVGRGDITGASFGFRIGESEWQKVEGRSVRMHTNVAQLLDVSPVTYPAYRGTDIALRAFSCLPAAVSRRGQLAAIRGRVLMEGNR